MIDVTLLRSRGFFFNLLDPANMFLGILLQRASRRSLGVRSAITADSYGGIEQTIVSARHSMRLK
jgi:hypothetical protein